MWTFYSNNAHKIFILLQKKILKEHKKMENIKQEIRDVKSSSGKIIGKVIITPTKVIVKHNTKPELTITDLQVIEEINKKSLIGVQILYDEYYLTNGEIAALYNLPYSCINQKYMPQLVLKTTAQAGRRNSRYAAEFSEETKAKIGKASKGRKNPNNYERTPEIRKKISESLKQYYATHEVSEETRKKLSQAWVDKKYVNSPMGTRIHGFFFSIKNNTKFYFRSLLELCYMLKLEEDPKVNAYIVEPFQIPLANTGTHHYTPDFLINGIDIKELKPSKHLNYIKEDSRFQQEIKTAESYAKEHNMTFEVVYDIDLNFETRRFKRYLLANPKIIKKYQISFDRDISKWS